MLESLLRGPQKKNKNFCRVNLLHDQRVLHRTPSHRYEVSTKKKEIVWAECAHK